MNTKRVYLSRWTIAILIIVLITTGCSGNVAATEATEPTPLSVPATSAPPIEDSPGTDVPEATAPSANANALYTDDFTNPATGWPEAQFDNYFIGYHEPEYYHVEISGTNYKTTVFEPQKQSFDNFTVELQVLTAGSKTAAEGDFRYGLAFRRSGDQYYAFTISPRTKKWFVLKSSPNQLAVLAEGTDDGIHNVDVDDLLRVDAQGSEFFFHINDQLVGQITDSDYGAGEMGFYVESFDSASTHIHFNTLTINNFEVPSLQESEAVVLYEDDFTNPTTGWTERQFDNYFIGYHEPEYYHVEITGPNYKTTVFEPAKQSYSDFTVEMQVLTAGSKTAAEGDFRYGVAFRRSGDQYYAFTISPRAKKWFVLKSSSSGLTSLAEGTNEDIHEIDVNDLLRVDVQGPDFLFHINDQLIAQVSDPDYAAGEIGFYVESVDSLSTHIHFDALTIRNLELSLRCSVVNEGTLYVRTGPGKTFAQIAVLSNGDSVTALGISPNQWIKVNMDGSDAPGWVSYDDGYLDCSPTVDFFPIVNP